MNISLGPIQYCWSKAQVSAFYQQVASSDIELIYLGETVCSRRRQLKFSDYLELAQILRASGKQVVLSTLALIEAQSEFTALKQQIDNGEFMVEANDMGAVEVAKSLGLPFICGPSINNYNAASLQKLAAWGMQRFVMPLELSKHWLERVLTDLAPRQIEVEVFGHGYMPLAHSARCFTARQQGLTKDSCQTICIDYPQGVLAQTQESQPLLRLNGIQTQSASYIDLSDQQQEMERLGVDYFRVSPSSLASIDLANNLTKSLAKNLATKGDSDVSQDNGSETNLACNGYWFGQAGFEQGR
ncbi:U32 family peptidase [Shewanella algidipiscicola]|uniref:Ubiquinone biosynthesis protein UbiV n=1 Tax=Shewanella algidipiscicola TaxID=614070 RepID=A0ABQ4NTB7_9GAMM|nr:U32 family peptidase [Shewanella algidipiscicola]GIU02885.1 U32 family peptidase [Shewanella algidipiscicola]